MSRAVRLLSAQPTQGGRAPHIAALAALGRRSATNPVEALRRPAPVAGPQLLDVYRGRSVLDPSRAWEFVLHDGFVPHVRPFPLSGAGGCSRDGLLDGPDVDGDAILKEGAGFPRKYARSFVAGQSAVSGHPLHVSAGLPSPSGLSRSQMSAAMGVIWAAGPLCSRASTALESVQTSTGKRHCGSQCSPALLAPPSVQTARRQC